MLYQEINTLIERYPKLSACEEDLKKATDLLIKTYQNNGKLLAMGNGGSSADAEHICGELMKGFLSKRKLNQEQRDLFKAIGDESIADKLQGSLPAISLGVGHSLISAFSNDVDPDFIFAQQIYGLGNKNDLIIGISTSGNSRNVVWGFKVAKALEIPTIALTGEKESESSKWADVCIKAPETITHIVQELHLPIYHCLCLEVENFFFKN